MGRAVLETLIWKALTKRSMGRLIFYDTSNYTDFPIGGQLTSIRAQLRFLCENRPDLAGRILLVGVTTDPAQVGHVSEIPMFGKQLKYLPAAVCETQLGHTAHSLRAAFAKGLLQCRAQLKPSREDLHYIHTPEAIGPIRLLCPMAKTVIFSHGSYMNMERGFRFFQKNVLIKKAFNVYLRYVLRTASEIFVLDEDSWNDYLPYNRHLHKIRNSIVLPDLPDAERLEKRQCEKRLVFIGRLSKDKGVEEIIRAVHGMESGWQLTIVGDGEQKEILTAMPEVDERIHFVGAVSPEQVPAYLQNADILVMNSAFEGVPMAILEALSYGVPVISTDVGGIGETVRFGLDAERTDGCAQSIQAAARTIAASYGQYCSHARQRAAYYDYRVVNADILKFLEPALAAEKHEKPLQSSKKSDKLNRM